MDFQFVALSAIIFFAYSIGATVGFGSSIISLTLAVHLYRIDYLIPVVVPLNLLICAYLAIRHHSGIDHRILLKKVLPLTCLGMPVGLYVFNTIGTDSLKFAFGLFVLCLSALELVHTIRSTGNEAPRPLNRPWSALLLFIGGIIQGIWVSGGPVVAYWAGRDIPDKKRFRSTLAALWLVLNAILFVSHWLTGSITADTGRTSLLLLPVTLCALVAGEWVHTRLPERAFRIFVYALLVFAGISLLRNGPEGRVYSRAAAFTMSVSLVPSIICSSLASRRYFSIVYSFEMP